MQERRIERLGNDLVVRDQQEIGRTRFLHIAARAEQHLVDAVLCLCGQRRSESRCVVAARLRAAKLFRRTRLLVFDQQLEWTRTAVEVVTDRRGQDVQRRFVRRRGSGADVRQRADQRRAQVERTRRRGNLVDVVANDVDDHLRQHVGIGNRQA